MDKKHQKDRVEFFTNLHSELTLSDDEARRTLLTQEAKAFISAARPSHVKDWIEDRLDTSLPLAADCIADIIGQIWSVCWQSRRGPNQATLTKLLSNVPGDDDQAVTQEHIRRLVDAFAEHIASDLREGSTLGFDLALKRTLLCIRLRLIVRCLLVPGIIHDDHRIDIHKHMTIFREQKGDHLVVLTGTMAMALLEWVKTYAWTSSNMLTCLLLLGPTGSGKSTMAGILQKWLASKKSDGFCQNESRRDFTGYDPKDVEATLCGLLDRQQGKQTTPAKTAEQFKGILTNDPKTFLFLDEFASYHEGVRDRMRVFIDSGHYQRLWDYREEVKFFGLLCLATNRSIEDDSIFPKDLQRRLRGCAITLPSAVWYFEHEDVLGRIVDGLRPKSGNKILGKRVARALTAAVRTHLAGRGTPAQGFERSQKWLESHGFGVVKDLANTLVRELLATEQAGDPDDEELRAIAERVASQRLPKLGEVVEDEDDIFDTVLAGLRETYGEVLTRFAENSREGTSEKAKQVFDRLYPGIVGSRARGERSEAERRSLVETFRKYCLDRAKETLETTKINDAPAIKEWVRTVCIELDRILGIEREKRKALVPEAS